MKLKETNYNDLIASAGSIRFRNQDIRESMEYGAKHIEDNYMFDRYSRYFMLYNNNIPIAPIQIKRDGFISFFISSELEPVGDGLKLIKTLRNLLKWYTDNYETTLFVRTANWYNEANRINAMVGFKKYRIMQDYTIWVYENNRTVDIPVELKNE